MLSGRQLGGSDHLAIISGTALKELDDPGTSQQVVPQPPGVVAGDYLVTYVSAYSTAGPSVEGATKWTQLSTPGGARAVIWGRTATGDSNDTFTYPSRAAGLGAVYFAQMIKISAVSGTISMFQTGTGNAGSVSGTGWPIGAITVGTEPTKTLVINMYSRRFETGGNHDAMTMQTPGESIEIGQMVTSVPSQNPHYMWSGWSYDYQAVSSEIPEQEISYTITRNNNQCITQRLRFKAT